MNLFPCLKKRAFQAPALCLSSLGAVLLFYVPYSSLVLLMLLGILGLTVFSQLLFLKNPVKKKGFRPGALVLSLVFTLIGFFQFLKNMAYHHILTALAEKFHISCMLNAGIWAGLLCVLGFYAFYTLAFKLEDLLCRMLSLPEKRKGSLPLSNLIFPLSALGFFVLEPRWNLNLISAAAAAVAMALIVSLHSEDFLSCILSSRGTRRLLAAFSALGIVLFRTAQANSGILGVAAGILSFPFLFLCLLAFYCRMDSVFERLGTFKQVEKKEKILYFCIFLAATLFSAVIFFQTDAFYGTPHEFDVIYTADSPQLIKENAFLSLRHPQNDLRQPLFFVFSAPFLGLSYLISRFLPMSHILRPLLMDWTQIAVLLLSNFLLARILKLDVKKRMIFMGLTTLSYPVLLFFLMMEQYIIVYFWLIFCIYVILSKKTAAELPLCAAGGTLLTSLILMPALSQHPPFREFKLWFSDMLHLLLCFAAAMLCCGRLDIILDAPTQLITMMEFSGQKLTALQKLQQYSGFFRQCLFAPEAGTDLVTMGHPSWQLLIPTGFSLLGILILCLALFSLLLHHKDSACRAAGLWILFSFAILFILGWGTQENGLVLYTLYFGWPIFLLLFRLTERLEKRIPHLTFIAGISMMILLAVINLPAIWKLISFARLYYPI